MFAVVRTGGKQYRVAPGDKIVVEKLAGNAGDQVTLGDVVLAGDGAKLQSTDGLTVAAEIIAQAKADKVTVFKKRRRHNYRRKKGHRQQHTILKIVAIGDHKEQKATPNAAPAKAAADPAKPSPEAEKPVKPGSSKAKEKANKEPEGITPEEGAGDVAGKPTENPAPDNPEQANPPANGEGTTSGGAKKAAPAKTKTTAETPSTENAAPAKGGSKKAPKAK